MRITLHGLLFMKIWWPGNLFRIFFIKRIMSNKVSLLEIVRNVIFCFLAICVSWVYTFLHCNWWLFGHFSLKEAFWSFWGLLGVRHLFEYPLHVLVLFLTSILILNELEYGHCCALSYASQICCLFFFRWIFVVYLKHIVLHPSSLHDPFVCHFNTISLCWIAGFGYVESSVDNWWTEAGELILWKHLCHLSTLKAIV